MDAREGWDPGVLDSQGAVVSGPILCSKRPQPLKGCCWPWPRWPPLQLRARAGCTV